MSTPQTPITPAQALALLSAARERLKTTSTAEETQDLARSLQATAEQIGAVGRIECRHGRLCRSHLLVATDSAVILAMVRTVRDNAARRQVIGAYTESEAELLRTVQGQLAEALFFARLWADGASAWDVVIARYMAESQEGRAAA